MFLDRVLNRIQFAVSVIMNAILICYCCSQIFDAYHI